MDYRSLEVLISDYFYQLLTNVLLLKIKPNFTIDNVTDLDEELIYILKNDLHIEGIILDVDDTLRTNGRNICEINKSWLKKMKENFKLIVVSNGIDGRIKEFFNNMGVDYIGFAAKPLRRSFLKACKSLDLNPKNVAVVGNNIITDIYGGNINNMTTIMVNEYSREKKLIKKR